MVKKLLSDREKFIIKLSLELKIPAHEIDEWEDKEIQRYLAYSQQCMLPSDRQEWYLAQISCVNARTMGGSDAKIEDFMIQFDSQNDEVIEEDHELFVGFQAE